MRKIIEKMKTAYKDICSKQFDDTFSEYFNDPKFINIFKKQYYSMIKNSMSIEALLSIGNLEDAYTIFRKYIETYILSISVLENPNVANKFLIHDKYLSYKATNTNISELREFYKDKPDGYLQYGYLEDIVDSSDPDFRYSIRTVAEASNVLEYYDWYRISNNFVHNNVNNVSIDMEDGIEKLIGLMRISSDYFIKRLMDIIKKITIMNM